MTDEYLTQDEISALFRQAAEQQEGKGGKKETEAGKAAPAEPTEPAEPAAAAAAAGDDSRQLSQDEISALFQQAQGQPAAAAAPAAPAQPAPPTQPAPSARVAQRAQPAPAAPPAQPAQPFHFGDLQPGQVSTDYRNIDLLLDVSVQITVELGRTSRRIRDVLALGPGAVVELEKLAGEPVDLLVNGKLIARGEVVVIGENFGVRITEIAGSVV